MESGIYQIRNTVNGKVYIGLSKHLDTRKDEHFAALRSNIHYNKHLQNAFNQYGEDAFEFSVLETCPESDLREREKYWISVTDAYKHGYNQTLGGDGILGYQQTDDEKRRRGESNRQHYLEHPERRLDISRVSKQYWSNKTHRKMRLAKMRESMSTEEYHEKLSVAAQRNWSNPEYLQNQAARFMQASHTPETQAKRIASLKATYENDPILRMQIGAHSRELWKTEEYRTKHQLSHSAAMQSPEYKALMSQISKERWQDPEYRAKVSLADKRAAQSRAKAVLQVETGTVYNSIADAAHDVGGSGTTAHIADCCMGHRKTACGFHWRYADETEEEWNLRRKEWVDSNGIKEYRKIVCVETGVIYDSPAQAAEQMNLRADKSGISHCCKGDQATCGGYHWRYADD